jgi:putative nucleotidyltransferase with HDIG domain
MNRDEAVTLVKKHLKNKNLFKHCLAVEACMRALADHFGEDPEKWGLAGILHDIDYEMTADNPEEHGEKSLDILQEYDIEPDILRAIQAHAGRVPCTNKMEWSIFAVDPLTGLIVAAALMHPAKKLAHVDEGFIQRRYQEKSFARGAKREDIEQIKNIGMSKEELIRISLKAMQDIDKELGL